MKQLYILQQYLNYLFKSKTKYAIHSPFIYNLITEVLEDSRRFYAFEEIEALRRQMLQDDTKIDIQDHGAGSHQLKHKKRKLSAIASATGVPPKYGQLLFRLAHYFKPGSIVELGSGTGLSAAYLAKGHSYSKIFTLEGDPILAEVTTQNLKHLKINNATVINAKFAEYLPKLLMEVECIDMAYIDGHHQYGPTMEYVQMLLPKVHNNSVLIIDDIHWSAEMTRAWSDLQNLEQVQVSVDLFRMGILFFRKQQKKQKFILKFS